MLGRYTPTLLESLPVRSLDPATAAPREEPSLLDSLKPVGDAFLQTLKDETTRPAREQAAADAAAAERASQIDPIVVGVGVVVVLIVIVAIIKL